MFADRIAGPIEACLDDLVMSACSIFITAALLGGMSLQPSGPPPAAVEDPATPSVAEAAPAPAPAPAEVPPGDASPPPGDDAPVGAEIEAVPYEPDPTPQGPVSHRVDLQPAPGSAPYAAALVDHQVAQAWPGYRRKRTGLLIGSGVALAASLGMFIGVIVDVRDLDGLCSDTSTGLQFEQCNDRLRRVTFLELGATTTGWAAMALAGVGGSFWGKAAAAEDWVGHARPRNARPAVIGGAATVGVGGAATIGSMVALFAACQTDEARCNFKTLQYSLGGFAAGVVVTSVGAAVLGYGVGHRRSVANWEQQRSQLTLAPAAGGMAVGWSGRF